MKKTNDKWQRLPALPFIFRLSLYSQSQLNPATQPISTYTIISACTLLAHFTHPNDSRDIADPWYTGDFATAYADILEGCLAFLSSIERI